MTDLKVHFSSETDLWSTPQDFFDRLDAEFGFTLDACATLENAKCADFISPEQDGLKTPWTGRGGSVFVNPPYGRSIGAWVQKAYYTFRLGALVAMLVPARTDTRWWQDYVMQATEVRFIRGRLKFGSATNSAPFPSAVVIFDPQSRPDVPTRMTAMSAT